MPVKHIISQIQYPEWAGPRYRHLDVLERFLYGKIYEHLRYPFYQEEESGTNAYIPLRERRPSVIYNLPRVVVDRTVRLLFGDKHWPRLHTNDKSATDYLQRLSETTHLQAAMLEAAFLGSLGSVAVFYNFVDDRFFYEVWNTKFCQPKFNIKQELEEVVVMYPTYGYDLRAMGFTIDDEDIGELFFYAKKFTNRQVIVYNPVKCEDYDPDEGLTQNADRTTTHKFGEVPGIWIKNFPA